MSENLSPDRLEFLRDLATQHPGNVSLTGETVLALLNRIKYLEGQTRRNYQDWQIAYGRAEAAEAAVQRVEDVLSKDAFSVQEDGFCADDLVDCDEIRAALKGPTSRQRLEAEKALRELHEEVWTDDPAPGGFVCKKCGVPVESEPCDVIHALDGGEQE